MSQNLYNRNILDQNRLRSPNEIKLLYPLNEVLTERLLGYRTTIENILDHQDPRLILVAGPCSIHDLGAAREYANRLKVLAESVKETFFVVMRVYFEKPRTTVGWKGFINDPKLDDTFDIETGLKQARSLLLELAEMDIPTGTEALDPVVPQYIHDLITWTAIGARTTESQTHRELASGISTPVGFKNGTDNNLDVAVNALQSSASPHHFLGIDQDGHAAIFHTSGNRYGHVVLRGGKQPNYDSVNISLCEETLKKAELPLNIMVDCSHGNSNKKPELQPLVMENVVKQISAGNRSIIGLMLESHLNWGNQPLQAPDALDYGVSITDSCIDWDTTEKVVLEAHEALKDILPRRWQS